MNKYFIHAVESQYQGLHGMYECDFVEAESPAKLEQLACEMSVEVMHSYHCIIEALEEEADGYVHDILEENEENQDYDEIFEDVMNDMVRENILFYIYKVKDEYVDIAEDEYESCRYTPEEIIEMFCEKGAY